MKIEKLANLRIVVYPDPGLQQKCVPITEFGGDLPALAQKMIQLMHDNNGVGLAAPQVGLQVRMFVCTPDGEKAEPQVLLNPQLIETDGAVAREEGCLSLPGVTVTMRRSQRAVLEAVDPHGKPVRHEADGLLARVWQHEIDHLDGKLIIDRMSEADAIANRKAIRQLEQDATKSRDEVSRRTKTRN